MTYPDRRRRNSLRYPGHDYSQAGSVFVTICTYGRQPLFGAIEDGVMVHSPAGVGAMDLWRVIPQRFPGIDIDAWVVMPDHVHGILHCGVEPEVAPKRTVGAVVRWFKSSTVEAYRLGVARDGWEPYERHFWQRNYHDRIIRSDRELEIRRAYIAGNPGR